MKRFVAELERRDQPRLRAELPCSLLVAGHSHDGIVCDLSESAVRVRTVAPPAAGAGAVVVFHSPAGERFALEATVPEWRTVSRSLSGCTEDQAVLQIESPPAGYVSWIRTESAKE
ncbi:MAG: PilZ domain-containing protein [Myxococcota bacterium]